MKAIVRFTWMFSRLWNWLWTFCLPSRHPIPYEYRYSWLWPRFVDISSDKFSTTFSLQAQSLVGSLYLYSWHMYLLIVMPVRVIKAWHKTLQRCNNKRRTISSHTLETWKRSHSSPSRAGRATMCILCLGIDNNAIYRESIKPSTSHGIFSPMHCKKPPISRP